MPPPLRITAKSAACALLLAWGCSDATAPGKRGTTPDTRPPSVQIQSPAAGAVLDADSVLVTGSATDDRGVVRLTYTLNGGAEQAVEAGTGTAVSYSFVVRGTALGANQLVVQAYDSAGNHAAANASFTVRDSVAPTVRVTSPAAGEMVGRDSAVVSGSAADNRKVARLAYVLDGGAEQTVQGVAGNTASFRFTVKGIAPGEHRLEVRAYDEAGNRGVQTLAFTISAAEVWITSPVHAATIGSLAVQLDGYVDSVVPVDSVTYSVNGGAERALCAPLPRGAPLCQRFPAGRSAFTWEADSLPRGDVQLRVFAYDTQKRRIGASQAVGIRVDVPVRYYRLTVPGAPGIATDLNNRGQMVGYTALVDAKAYFWDGTSTTNLGIRVPNGGRPVLLNDNARVAIYQVPDDNCEDLFTWSPGQGAPVRVNECAALRDMNNSGTLLVQLPFAGAILSGGQRTLLDAGGSGINPLFINDVGQIVGNLAHRGNGWIFTDRPPQPFDVPCDPKGLNNKGEVLCQNQEGLVISGSQKFYLPQIGRKGTSGVVAINNRSQVVGTFRYFASRPDPVTGAYAGGSRLFLWEGGRMYLVEIREPGWEIASVVDVNDSGVILVQAWRTGSGDPIQGYPVLLTPES